MIAFYENKRNNELICFKGKNMIFPLHLHNEIEILICTKGEVSVCCDGMSHTLYPNDAVFVYPNTIHSYETSKSCDYYILICSLNLLSDFNEYFNYSLKSPFITNTDNEILRSFKKIINLKNKKILLQKGYLYIILSTLFESVELTEKKLAYSTIETVIDFISNNFTNEITLDDVAKNAGINSSYLSRIFSEKIGTNFKSYLNELRINYAKQILKCSNKPITDIAFDSGFSTQRTFNRCFFEFTNMSPREFRNKNSSITNSNLSLLSQPPN